MKKTTVAAVLLVLVALVILGVITAMQPSAEPSLPSSEGNSGEGGQSASAEMGAPLSAIVDFETDYRFLVCGNYTAFYRFENRTVYIVRVLYGRRDFMRILFGEPNETK